MYLKYTVNGNPTQIAATGTGQIAWEISEILMGNITDMSTLTYGSAVKEGTGPTAGVYTRQRPTSSGSHPHIRFKKKHCQYDASTLPAEVLLQVFDDGGNYNISNGKYICPSNGIYLFHFHALSAGTGTDILIRVNASNVAGMGTAWGFTSGTAEPDGVTVIYSLSQNDAVTCVAPSASVYDNYCWFTGVKLYNEIKY